MHYKNDRSFEQIGFHLMHVTSLLVDCIFEGLEEALKSTDLIISSSAASLLTELVHAKLLMNQSTYHRVRATTLARLGNTNSQLVGRFCEDLLLELADCSPRTTIEIVREDL